MIFSKRLSSIQAHLVFVVCTVSAIILVRPQVRPDAPDYAFSVLATMIVIFTFIGTVGWQRGQREASTQLVRAYFTAQIGLLVFMMLLELIWTQYSPATAILAFMLVGQSSVLDVQGRRLVFVVVVMLVLFIEAVSTPRDILPPQVLFLIILAIGVSYYVVLLFGSMIVREERAIQVSLKLDEDNRKLTKYAAQAEELATLRERNRLAREIHDNLGHYLTTVNVQIEVAMAVLETDPPRAHTALNLAQSLTKEGLSEIRRSIHALRANPIEHRALHEAILLLVEQQRAAGNTIYYEVQGLVRPCSAAVEMTLYRIAQEGLTNIHKHAHANQINLTLTYHDLAHVSLELWDNGIGAVRTDGGFGLVGVRERVELLNGKFAIQTAVGAGFRLQVELPI